MIDLKSLYEKITELQQRLEKATLDRAVLEEQVSAQTQTNKNRISELNSRKNKLTTQLKALQRQRSSSENIITIDKLDAQITTLDQQIKKINSEKEKLSSTKPESTSALENINVQISGIVEEYNQLIRSSKSSIEEEKRNIEAQYKVLSAITPEVLAELSQKLKQLDVQRAELEQQSYDLLQERNDLQRKINDVEYFEYHDDFKSRINEINTILKQLETKKAQIDEDVLSSKQEFIPKLKTLNKELSALKAEKEEKEASLKNQKTVLEQKHQALLLEKAELEKKLSDSTYIDYHSQFNSRISAINGEIKQLLQSQDSYPQELSSLENTILQKESEIANLFSITPETIAIQNAASINYLESRINQLNTISRSLIEIDLQKNPNAKTPNRKAKKTRKENNSPKGNNTESLLNGSFIQVLKAIDEVDSSISANFKEQHKKKNELHKKIHDAMHQAREDLKKRQNNNPITPPEPPTKPPKSPIKPQIEPAQSSILFEFDENGLDKEIDNIIRENNAKRIEKSENNLMDAIRKAKNANKIRSGLISDKSQKPQSSIFIQEPMKEASNGQPYKKEELSEALKGLMEEASNGQPYKKEELPEAIKGLMEEASNGQPYKEELPEAIKGLMEEASNGQPLAGTLSFNSLTPDDLTPDDLNDQLGPDTNNYESSYSHAQSFIDPGLKISTSEPEEETSLTEQKPSVIRKIGNFFEAIIAKIQNFWNPDGEDNEIKGTFDFGPDPDEPNSSNKNPSNTSFRQGYSTNLKKHPKTYAVIPGKDSIEHDESDMVK